MIQFDFAGRAAIVTGSSRGIGRAIADEFRVSGASVLYHSRDGRAADLPPEEVCLAADLFDPDAPAELIKAAWAAAPGLDILVCNAGSFFDVPFLEMTPDRWRQTVDLNVRAPYFLIQAFARGLKQRRRPGSVVLISSTNGFQAEQGSTAYDTSKGALVMMTRTLALALADQNIRVNSVAPGLIRTPATAWLETNDAERRHYERDIPVHRIGLPEDCTGAALFLCSEAARYITGQVIIVDGGLTVRQIGEL